MAHRILAGIGEGPCRGLVWVGWLVLWGACLSDLPPALECPSPALIAEGDCSSIRAPLIGCIPPTEHACLAGERTSCACLADECPLSEATCFPAPDCPPEVTAVAPHARCTQVTADDIGDFGLVDPVSNCTCGCTECLSVCDGRGPTFGVALNGDGALGAEDFFIPFTRIDRLMPNAGRFGLYVRLRGLSPLVLQVFKGDVDGDPEGLVTLRSAIVPASVGSDYGAQVLFEEFLEGGLETTPIQWTEAADRPSLLAFFPPLDRRGHTLVQIDCIVPFVVE